MPLQLVRPLVTLVRWADGMLDWLLTYALHSTMLIVAVWLLVSSPLGHRLRLTSAAWLWLVALCGGVLTATLQTSGVLVGAGGTLRLAAETPTRAAVRVELPARPAAPTSPADAVPPHRTFATTLEISPRWPLAVMAGWIAGVLLMLGGFAWARWRFFRSIAGRRTAHHTLAANALREVQRRASVRRPIRLTVATALASPVAIGRDEICLPERALSELELGQQEVMLAHELAHLERGDSRWLVLARVIEAVFFFQPLNRLARRRMQDAAEFACDVWALRVLARPMALARCLARVAEWSLASPRLLAPAMAGRRGSMLLQRVERLTNGRAIGERGAGPAAAVIAAGALLALALLAPKAAVGAPPGPAFPGFRQATDVRVVRLRPAGGAGRIAFRGGVRGDIIVLRLRDRIGTGVGAGPTR